jgi:phosphatidylglycerophosphate synthase
MPEDTIERKIKDRDKNDLDPWEYTRNESITEMFINTTKSAVDKTFRLIKNPIGKNHGGFLHWINEAWITPNNIGTFRLFLLVMWILLYSIWEKWTWLGMFAISAWLDWLDGKIATKFNKKSIEGELYDAWIDKMLEIIMSITATTELILNNNKILAIIAWILTTIKAWQHIKSQTRKWRPTLKEQKVIFFNAALNDESIKFVEKKSERAANNAWKNKTTLQFWSSIWIIWVSIFLEEYLKAWGMDNIVYLLLLAMSWASIYYWQQSISGKK